MSSSRLRRSSRAPKKIADQISEYNVGDTVEINRNGATVRARLVQLLTEGSSPNPRWLIHHVESSYKNEEAYEHTFVGKVLSTADDDATPFGQSLERNSSGGSKGSRKNSPVPQSDTGSESRRAARKKKGSDNEKGDADAAASDSSLKASPIQSDDTSSSAAARAAARVSAREARSRRRQAIIDERKAAAPSSSSNGQRSNNGGTKRKLSGAAKASVRNKRAREGEDDCVKVKFLTGTLYLYRGKHGRHRRAEFVRRV